MSLVVGAMLGRPVLESQNVSCFICGGRGVGTSLVAGAVLVRTHTRQRFRRCLDSSRRACVDITEQLQYGWFDI